MKKICFVISFFILIFVSKNSLSQCFKAKNGDEISIKILKFAQTDKIIDSLDFYKKCEASLDTTTVNYYAVDCEMDSNNVVVFYNITANLTYYYVVESTIFAKKVKSFEEDFKHLLLDDQDVVFSFKSGCTIFHVKFYNPNSEQDNDMSVWIKIWADK